MIVDKKTIQRAKQKLGDRNAMLIAEILGVERFDSRNLKGLCPFHAEDTPSFIYDKKGYYMHCFGCGKSVDVIEAYMSTGHTFLEAVQFLFDHARIRYNFGEQGVKTKRAYRYPKPEPLDDKTKVYEYLGKRKISQKTVDYLDIRQDKEENCVFNYYDTNDVLTMVKYRPSHRVDKSKGDDKNWCQKGADTTPLLFNMNRVNTTMPLLITEGELDCAAAIESGYLNAVSVPLGANNYHWLEENWDWLEQFDSVILCSDNDEAGNKMRKEVSTRLGTWRTRFVELPMNIQDRPIKDLNELLYYGNKEQVLNVILNAKENPIDTVIDFADIQAIDLADMDGIQTGFKELDKALFKLFYGTLTIVTGINGSGKSSFLSQLVCNSLEQGCNVFQYSGELPAFQQKTWLNHILAGRYHVNKYMAGNIEYFKVNPTVQKDIDAWCNERLFIYKDGQSHSPQDMLNTMEAAARKYGCKLFIIDNLTSLAMGSREKDRWDNQENFVRQLISFAVKFQVAPILVVHPHKIETIRRLTKMDVQGAGGMIDLAHRILSLYRVQAADREPTGKKKRILEGDVVCDILKDRMRGYEGQSIEFFYDKPSRRFFTDYEDLYFQYGWDTDKHDREEDPIPVPQLEDRPI